MERVQCCFCMMGLFLKKKFGRWLLSSSSSSSRGNNKDYVRKGAYCDALIQDGGYRRGYYRGVMVGNFLKIPRIVSLVRRIERRSVMIERRCYSEKMESNSNGDGKEKGLYKTQLFDVATSDSSLVVDGERTKSSYDSSQSINNFSNNHGDNGLLKGQNSSSFFGRLLVFCIILCGAIVLLIYVDYLSQDEDISSSLLYDEDASVLNLNLYQRWVDCSDVIRSRFLGLIGGKKREKESVKNDAPYHNSGGDSAIEFDSYKVGKYDSVVPVEKEDQFKSSIIDDRYSSKPIDVIGGEKMEEVCPYDVSMIVIDDRVKNDNGIIRDDKFLDFGGESTMIREEKDDLSSAKVEVNDRVLELIMMDKSEAAGQKMDDGYIMERLKSLEDLYQSDRERETQLIMSLLESFHKRLLEERELIIHEYDENVSLALGSLDKRFKMKWMEWVSRERQRIDIHLSKFNRQMIAGCAARSKVIAVLRRDTNELLEQTQQILNSRDERKILLNAMNALWVLKERLIRYPNLPFDHHCMVLNQISREIPDIFPLMNQFNISLEDYSKNGIASLESLKESFIEEAKNGRRASIDSKPNNIFYKDGVRILEYTLYPLFKWWHIIQYNESPPGSYSCFISNDHQQLWKRTKSDWEIIHRAQNALESHQLQTTLNYLDQLSPDAKNAMKNWIESAEQQIFVHDSIETISSLLQNYASSKHHF